MANTHRTALITGASSGIGEALAHLFAADGHDLVLTARRKSKLERLAETLTRAHDVRVSVIPSDLTDPAAPALLVEETKRLGVAIDFLVNSAGFGSNGRFHELDLERELAMVQVNVAATLALTHRVLPGMIERGFGRVLTLGSTAGFQGGPFMATYYASKAFVIHFSEALWFELRGTGVTTTVSCPGPVATEFAGIAGNDRSNLFQGSVVASAEDVARSAYEAMNKGKRMVVHGLKYKALTLGQRLGPRSTALAVAARLNRPA